MSEFLVRRFCECRDLAIFLRRHWLVTLAVLVLYAAAKYWLWVNLSPSLPYHLVWLERGASPARGELMIYRFAGEPLPGLGPLDRMPFFKRVAGLPGDPIRVEDRVVSVAGIRIGYAKRRTHAGLPLDPLPSGVIPEGYLFAQGESRDSFDSRYAQSGLVSQDRVLGVAHVIF